MERADGVLEHLDRRMPAGNQRRPDDTAGSSPALCQPMEVENLDDTISEIEGAGCFVRGAEDADTGRRMAGLLQRHRVPHLWSDAG